MHLGLALKVSAENLLERYGHGEGVEFQVEENLHRCYAYWVDNVQDKLAR